MDDIKKSFASKQVKKADAEADIGLINQYALKELKPEEVFCFSAALCDNEVDRDFQRFSDGCLEALAGLFPGKTGIRDHDWSAENQISRIYRCEVEAPGAVNTLGEPLHILKASAYMLRTEANADTIAAIEGGIIREISIGCAIRRRTCSICGNTPWESGCSHIKGQKYGDKLCFHELSDPSDAYEFSFVAVPAQPGAGVTKGREDADADKAFELLMTADLTGREAQAAKLVNRLRLLSEDAETRARRAQILEENKKFVKGALK